MICSQCRFRYRKALTNCPKCGYVPPKRFMLEDALPLIPQVSPRNRHLAKTIFRLLFLITISSSLYLLYVADNLPLFFLSLSFSLTILILYFITFSLSLGLAKSKNAYRRPQPPLKAKTFRFPWFFIFSISLFLALVLSYFYYLKPKMESNPAMRLDFQSVQAKWHTIGQAPQFIIKATFENRNPFNLYNLSLKAKIYSSQDPNFAIEEKTITIHEMPNNESIPLDFVFDNLPTNLDLKYSLSVQDYRL